MLEFGFVGRAKVLLDVADDTSANELGFFEINAAGISGEDWVSSCFAALSNFDVSDVDAGICVALQMCVEIMVGAAGVGSVIHQIE